MMITCGGFRYVLALATLAVAFINGIASDQSAVPKKIGVVFGDVVQRDRSRPIYKVQFPAIGELYPENRVNEDASDSNNGEVMHLVTAQGQAMECIIPEIRMTKSKDGDDDHHGIDKSSEMSLKENEEEDVFKGIDEMMSMYENQCYFRTIPREWWTFEFCYGKYVKQIHRPTGGSDPPIEFILGVYNREADLERRKTVSEVSEPDAAFTQVFDHGTLCDLTGRPRKTIVKFKCLEETRRLGESVGEKDFSLISNVKEVETCVYEIDFVNGAICNHPLYRKSIDDNIYAIRCSMQEDAGPFKGIGAESYSKASITL